LQLPPSLPLREWTRIGRQIGLLHSCSAWWLGDWLVYGRENYPNRYRQASAGTSLEYQTLRNYAWVAGRFEMPRRRETLSFQHHAAVAAMPTAQQDLWLDLCSSRRWSIKQLRAQLRMASGNTANSSARGKIALELSVDAERRDRWQAAADRSMVTLTDWATKILDDIAAQILDDQRSPVFAVRDVPDDVCVPAYVARKSLPGTEGRRPDNTGGR
jgi:hypothetical protein